jgi:predicted dehydrogenase
MHSPVRTSVIGVGLAATAFHVPLVLISQSLFVLHSVVERNPPAEVQPEGTIAKKFGVSVKLVHSLDDVLNDPEVELVSLFRLSFLRFT